VTTKKKSWKVITPDRIGLDDVDVMYDGLSWDQKLEIYLDRNPDNRMNPDDYHF
jgi:hypothetical protein